MAYMKRDFRLPFLMSGAAMGAWAIASCSATPQPLASSCKDVNGTLVCDAQEEATGAGTSPGSNTTTGSGGIPMLDSAAATGTGGIPMLDNAAVASSTTGSGGSGTVTTGTQATSATGVQATTTTTGAQATTTTGAQATTTTGGTSGGTLGTIRVSADSLDRDHTIVSFPFPAGQGKAMALDDGQGNQIPLQYSSVTGDATFILPSLAAGATQDYTVVELPQAAVAVTTAQEGDHLFVKMGESTVFRWTLTVDNFRGAAENNERAGYIYPLYTPGGLNVADDYQSDHPHMHGIWSAWTNTTFRDHHVDFWNGFANEGRVDLNSMEGVWQGPVHGGLIANLDHIDITETPNVVVLAEKWVVRVYKTHEAAAPYYVFDIESVQNIAAGDPLILEQYHYGGFGFRGSEEWTNTGNVTYLTSEGQNRSTGDQQNNRWCAFYGAVQGQTAGYAGLGHPDNFRAPQGIRIHPTNPYWAFTPVTPLSGGRFELQDGEPYVSHFRVISFDGPADAAFLDRQWNDYATPPTVQVLP